ncbi:alpha/beta hydrolase [uncultured Cycloclasticus sp.]|uniref:alpha/beta hydrolase n=1 Tax=uncultured Cycloclasticus sp. TaxID=172194 RepID=UPI00258D6E6F|nr:alpha/beta hydrolase [uncultured Cycloclasticus sp.]
MPTLQSHAVRSTAFGEFEAVMIENCGHVPHVEQPDLVPKRRTDFLKRLAV